MVLVEEYKEASPIFEKDVYEEISLKTCVEKRISEGGTGPASVEAQIRYIKDYLK